MYIPYKFVYLSITLLALIPWAIFFFRRKDLRKEMLLMSIIFAVFGLIPEYFLWTRDWWHPQTITGTRIGVEDFLLGFTNGGLATVLYQEFFKFKNRKSKMIHVPHFLFLCFAGFIVVEIALHIFHLNSFLATVGSFLTIIVLISFFRKDLIKDILISGILATIGSLPFYYFAIIFSPGWINQAWNFHHLTGITITGIPLEDLVFYFLIGSLVGPLYLYAESEKLQKISLKIKIKTKKR